MAQEPKQIINTGVKGNQGTGDIIYDGGEKINLNFDGIYNSFSDATKYSINNGEGLQKIHGTGYYQRYPNSYYNANMIEMGSMHNVDTSTGPLNIRLPKGVPGECVVFVNTNGSLSVDSPARITPNEMDVILGHTSTLELTLPHTRTELWCVNNANGISVWTYKIVSLFGNEVVPINGTYIVDKAIEPVKIGPAKDINTIKLLLSGISNDGTKIKASEILVAVDIIKGEVYSNEFSVLKNSEDEVFKATFSVEGDGSLYLILEPTNAYAKVSVKSTDLIRIGE